MEQKEIKKLCKERGIVYKGDFVESLTEEEFKNGTAKFNLTAPDGRDVEGIWCWLAPEDREKYEDDNFYGEINVILCNDPLNYYGILFWGCEVEITCRGIDRPVISKNYIENVLLPIINGER